LLQTTFLTSLNADFPNLHQFLPFSMLFLAFALVYHHLLHNLCLYSLNHSHPTVP